MFLKEKLNSPAIKLLIDLTLWGAAGLVAYAYRKPTLTSMGIPANVLAYLLISIGIIGTVELYTRLHYQDWRRVGLLDLRRLARAMALATMLTFALAFLLQDWLQLPRSVPVLSGVLGFLMLGGVRLLARVVHEHTRRQPEGQRRRVLIVGAGNAGSMIAREMQRHPESGLEPVGFLDDEPTKRGTRLVGLRVFGPVESLADVATRERAQEILIAIPSADGQFVRHVVDLAREADLRYRIIPGVFEILSGEVGINQIRDVDVEDLLRRAPVKLNTAEIAGFLRGKVVLVTGAGGSIGSEIVRQVAAFQPAMILLFGRGENSVFSIQQELPREVRHVGLIGDVRDLARLRVIFERYRPQVVFHAAAHKHVPLMEEAPSEAILNNVLGTRNVVDLCLEFGAERLVNVSTDKAVNPTSVMGASKRVAEMVVSAGAMRAHPGQAFVSVRFGNVLGSRGSVVPTFMRQIRAGDPITVTHPDMVRYFMTIPEAARLVLQAGGLAENGKVYVLNMGDPVNISDLARDLIRLSGARDVQVVYSGIRPGEKLYEELLTSEEGADATTHSEIFSARLERVDPQVLEAHLDVLQRHAVQGDAAAIRTDLARMIPENKFGQIR